MKRTTKKIVNKMIKEQTGYDIEIEKVDGIYYFVDNTNGDATDHIVSWFEEACTHFIDLDIDPQMFVDNAKTEIWRIEYFFKERKSIKLHDFAMYTASQRINE